MFFWQVVKGGNTHLPDNRALLIACVHLDRHTFWTLRQHLYSYYFCFHISVPSDFARSSMSDFRSQVRLSLYQTSMSIA
jgi:hypothetical protein